MIFLFRHVILESKITVLFKENANNFKSLLKVIKQSNRTKQFKKKNKPLILNYFKHYALKQFIILKLVLEHIRNWLIVSFITFPHLQGRLRTPLSRNIFHY